MMLSLVNKIYKLAKIKQILILKSKNIYFKIKDNSYIYCVVILKYILVTYLY